MLARSWRGVPALAAVLASCATGEQVEQQQGPFISLGSGGSDAGASAGAENGGSTSPATGGTSANGGSTLASGGSTPATSGGRPSAGAGQGGAATSAAGVGGTAGGAGGRAGSSGSAGSSGTGGASGGGGATGKGGTAGNEGATGGAAGGMNCATTDKVCGGICVPRNATNGCSATDCTVCPAAPTNGVRTCDAQGDCAFDCLSGFQKNGNQCTMGTGNGGAGGGGSVSCNNIPCIPCPGGQVTCCDRILGILCVCALSNQASTLCR